MSLSSVSRFALPLLALSLLSVLPACQTTRVATEFPAPGADWKSSVGQLQYVTPARSVIGETVVSRHGARDFQLDYVAGPGVPLMRLRESGASAHAEGVFARGSWSGNPARAGRLASWMALREIFASLEGSASPHVKLESAAGAVPQWKAEGEFDGRRPHRVRAEFPKTGERFVFVFGR